MGVVLDSIDSGAATPWAVAWSRDGRQLLIKHAGTDELSVIDFPALLAKLARVPAAFEPGQPVDDLAASRTAADVPNDLSFLVGVGHRVELSGKCFILAAESRRPAPAHQPPHRLQPLSPGAVADAPCAAGEGDRRVGLCRPSSHGVPASTGSAVTRTERPGSADGLPAKAGTPCGAVFASIADPGYQAIRAMIVAGQEFLDRNKRFDMTGFVPRADWFREMQRYGMVPPVCEP